MDNVYAGPILSASNPDKGAAKSVVQLRHDQDSLRRCSQIKVDIIDGMYSKPTCAEVYPHTACKRRGTVESIILMRMLART